MSWKWFCCRFRSGGDQSAFLFGFFLNKNNSTRFVVGRLVALATRILWVPSDVLGSTSRSQTLPVRLGALAREWGERERKIFSALFIGGCDLVAIPVGLSMACKNKLGKSIKLDWITTTTTNTSITSITSNTKTNSKQQQQQHQQLF